MQKTTLALCVLLLVSSLLAPRAFAADTALTLPKALTEVADEAFRGCGAASVVIPDGVTTIGALAFADCKSMTAIHIPSSVTEIADNAFDGHSRDLVIYCEEGSAARTFAVAHGISYAGEGDILLPEI